MSKAVGRSRRTGTTSGISGNTQTSNTTSQSGTGNWDKVPTPQIAKGLFQLDTESMVDQTLVTLKRRSKNSPREVFLAIGEALIDSLAGESQNQKAPFKSSIRRYTTQKAIVTLSEIIEQHYSRIGKTSVNDHDLTDQDIFDTLDQIRQLVKPESSLIHVRRLSEIEEREKKFFKGYLDKGDLKSALALVARVANDELKHSIVVSTLSAVGPTNTSMLFLMSGERILPSYTLSEISQIYLNDSIQHPKGADISMKLIEVANRYLSLHHTATYHRLTDAIDNAFVKIELANKYLEAYFKNLTIARLKIELVSQLGLGHLPSTLMKRKFNYCANPPHSCQKTDRFIVI